MSIEEYKMKIEAQSTDWYGKERAKRLMMDVANDDIEYHLVRKWETDIAATAIALGL